MTKKTSVPTFEIDECMPSGETVTLTQFPLPVAVWTKEKKKRNAASRNNIVSKFQKYDNQYENPQTYNWVYLRKPEF